jgi:acylphosphatase
METILSNLPPARVIIGCVNEPIRKTVYYTGRVQGVGFRYTACSVAREYDVTGRVRNLPDGRVELVVEGMAGEIERFFEGIRRAMAGNIRDEQITESPSTGQWSEFDVSYW